MSPKVQRKRVLIVGAGAAGVAAAYSLGKHPDRFDVQVWEKGLYAGGAASSELIEGSGNCYVNDQVQGGTPSYRNTLNLTSQAGFSTSVVKMNLSFGRGCTYWTNHTKTDLTVKHRNEIKRFGKTLRIINTLSFFFMFIPTSTVLRLFGYSKAFCSEMVYPLLAFFFGTSCFSMSAAIVAKVFLDNELKLFHYDDEGLLNQKVEIFCFPVLRDMYKTIMLNTGVTFYPQRAIHSVTRGQGKIVAIDEGNTKEVFDEIIFACSAEDVLGILKEPSFLERTVFGSVVYTPAEYVTHEDTEYVQKNYEFNEGTDHVFLKMNPLNPSDYEMTINFSNMQKHVKESDRKIYNTFVFGVDKNDVSEDEKIDKKKILFTKTLRHFIQRWQHFAITVPLIRFIQGASHSWYSGSYTLVDAHEIAIMSGFAVACRLGADYPFPEDKIARKQFEQYMLVTHGRPPKFGCNMATIKSVMIAPLMYIFAGLLLFAMVFVKCFGKCP